MKKKITLLLLEITAIIVLVVVIATLGIDRYNKVFKNYPIYFVEFEDVDGLDIGCPVRLAGLHVGHIVKEEIKNDKILVTFKITRKNLKIPKGSTAGIEFAGLVGSKSLEIRPPELSSPKGQLIYTKEPLRVSSIMEIQNNLAKVVLEVSDSAANFLEKNKLPVGSSLQKAGDSIKETSARINETREIMEETKQTVVESTKNIKKVTENANETLAEVNKTLSSVASGKDVQQSVDKIKESTEKLAKLVEKDKMEERIVALNENLKNLSKNAEKMNTEINKAKNRETGYLKDFSSSMKSTANKLDKFASSLEKKDAKNESSSEDNL